jgi:hypothetical protein
MNLITKLDDERLDTEVFQFDLWDKVVLYRDSLRDALLAKEKAERQLCRAREAIYAERERISLPIYDRLIISTLPPTIPCRHAEELEKLKKEVGR